MNKDFILRSGKYSGKSIGWLEENQEGYLIWIKENRPEMLKGSDKPTVKFKEKNTPTMEPNLNFFNEGPHEMSKAYILKHKNDESNGN